MRNQFNSVPATMPKRHKFSMPHEVKTTFEMGELVPFFCEETLPGDRFRISTAQLIRFAPMLAPAMTKIDAYVHFFFVPNRIIWKDWESFITQSENGKALKPEEVPIKPKIAMPANSAYRAQFKGKFGYDYLRKGSLADYLGFQTYSDTFNGGVVKYDAAPPLKVSE